MIIYESTKQQFMDDVTEDTIAVKIHNQYVQKSAEPPWAKSTHGTIP